jgi:hypothetical protein
MMSVHAGRLIDVMKYFIDLVPLSAPRSRRVFSGHSIFIAGKGRS